VFAELDTCQDAGFTVLGQAMGLVALTVGCLALGAYMRRDLTGGAAVALSVNAVICLVGLNSACADGATPGALGSA